MKSRMAIINNKICFEFKGLGSVFIQNADGEYDCEPCLCMAYPEEMIAND